MGDLLGRAGKHSQIFLLDSANEYVGYDIKLDGKAPVLEYWGECRELFLDITPMFTLTWSDSTC